MHYTYQHNALWLIVYVSVLLFLRRQLEGRRGPIHLFIFSDSVEKSHGRGSANDCLIRLG